MTTYKVEKGVGNTEKEGVKYWRQLIRGLDLVHGLLFEDFTVSFSGLPLGWAIAEAIVEKILFFILPLISTQHNRRLKKAVVTILL
jgi:hypothetical protein